MTHTALRFLILAGAAFGASASFAAETSKSPEWANVADADLRLMGDYQGKWLDAPEKSYQDINPTVSAQVINVDDGEYRVVFVQDLNLRSEPYFDGPAKLVDGRIVCSEGGYDFAVDRSGLKGVAKIGGDEIRFELKRVELGSPTLGAKAPEGAVVLLDGSNLDEWKHSDGRAITWTLLPDGVMEINPKAANKDADPVIGGEIRTKREFKDCQLHLEFRYPVEPGKAGQKRGNSGVFLQGYETQVLNSYGLDGNWNELGALYKLSPPRVNAARPPMQWQTYDIDYRAPRFRDGEVSEYGRITVKLNGIYVQKDEELIHGTEHREADRLKPAPRNPAPLRLQDHSNRIQFRNIWILEK